MRPGNQVIDGNQVRRGGQLQDLKQMLLMPGLHAYSAVRVRVTAFCGRHMESDTAGRTPHLLERYRFARLRCPASNRDGRLITDVDAHAAPCTLDGVQPISGYKVVELKRERLVGANPDTSITSGTALRIDIGYIGQYGVIGNIR